MENENESSSLIPPQKIGIILLILSGVILILSGLAYFLYFEKSANAPTTGQPVADSLDEFIKSQPDLLSIEEASNVGLSNKELEFSLQKHDQSLKVILLPKMLVGGDAVYEPVVQTDQGIYLLEEANKKNIFVVENKDDALKYFDFIMTKAGKNSYDRARKTISNESDYAEAGCRSALNNEDFGLPEDKPISRATEKDGKFLIDWIYSTEAFPAGFYAERYSVDKQGGIEPILESEKPFWSCGQGIMF